MTELPKAITHAVQSLSKSHWQLLQGSQFFFFFFFFAGPYLGKIHPKIYIDSQKILNTQNTLGEEQKTGGLTRPGFKTSDKATAIKATWQQKHRTKSTERRDLNPHIRDQVIPDKGAKTIHWGQDGIFNKWCWDNVTATCQRIKLNLVRYIILTSELEMGRRPKTIKLLEESTGGNLHDMRCNSGFLAMTSKAEGTKE